MLTLDISAVANSTHFSAIAQASTPLTAEHSTSWQTSDLQNLNWFNLLLRSASSESIKHSTTILDLPKHDTLPEYLSSSINGWFNNKLLTDGLPVETTDKEKNTIKFLVSNDYDVKLEYPKELERKTSNTLQTNLKQAKKILLNNPTGGSSQPTHPVTPSSELPTEETLPVIDNTTGSNQPPLPKQNPLPAPLPSFENLENRIKASVRWDTIEAKTNDLSFGLNAYQGFRVGNLEDQAYQQNLSFMSPGIVRFHNGGMMEDSSTTDGVMDYASQTWDKKKLVNGLVASYDAFGEQQPERMINIPTWPDWMDVNKDGFLDSNQYDNYAKLCADLVKIVNQEYDFNVKYWEITNEKDDHYFTHFRASGGWGGLKDSTQPDHLNELITIYNKVAIAMKEVDPTIQVGGPGLARSDLQPFYVPFIQGTVDNLDFFTYHYYASGSASTSDQDIYEATNAIGDYTATMVKILKEASPNREIPVMLGEYNISWTWETRDPRMTNHKGVVFDALSTVRALKNGAAATLAWNEKDGVYGKTDHDNNLRLGGNFLQLMNQYLVGDRVATTSSNEKAITTYAVSNNALNEKSYLIINHSGSDQKIQLDFGNWSPKQQDIKGHEIAASGYSTKTLKWSDLSSGINLPVDSITLLNFAD